METMIKLPAKILCGVQTFAIDFGGSVLKLAYIKKNDIHPEGYIIIRLKSFSRENVQEAFHFIERECEIPGPKDGEFPEYVFTGVGTHQFQKVMRDQLKIRISTTFELSCFTEAYKVLVEHLTEEQLFHAPVYEEDEAIKKLVENFSKVAQQFQMKAETSDSDINKQPVTTAKWTGLLGILGSGFAFCQIPEDGAVVRGAYSNRGGRMFLGLGSLLTGAKTYKELIELAERGKDRNVHCYTKELAKENEADEPQNLYGSLNQLDMLSFSYGWCVGKSTSDFSREDLARAILVNLCQEIVQTSLDLVDKLKVTRVVLVGGFAQAAITRHILEEEFMKVSKVAAAFRPTSLQGKATLHVMKAGSYLGALGAMLQSKPKPESQPEKTTESAAAKTKLKEKAVK